MSEEEREIDVELDERENDDDLDQASLGGQYDNKRALHNAMERKRRDSIKDSFKGLQDCIPTLKGDKTSRAQVLKKTGEYITHMQRKITDHQDEIKSLKAQNNQLEGQIKALEKAKASGNFVSAREMLQSENLVAGEDLDLTGLNGSEIIYDDASSDTSDSTNGAVNGKPGGIVVSLPPAVSLPTMATIQPGQSLLTSNRVQPGQSLLISEPMRKKMKISNNSGV